MIEDDLEPLITECPNCATRFRVTENQLAVAAGRVRCGACLTVFEGTDHLLLDEETPFTTESEADAALDELLDELSDPEPERASVVRVDFERANERSGVGSVDAFDGPPQIYGGFEEEAERSLLPETDDDPDRTLGEDEVVTGETVPPAAIEDGWVEHDRPVADARVNADESVGGEFDAAFTADFEEPGSDEGAAFLEDGDDYPDLDDPQEAGDQGSGDEAFGEGTFADEGSAAESSVDESFLVQGSGYDPPVRPETDDELDPVLTAEIQATPVSFAPEPRRWWVGAVALVFVLALVAQVFFFQFSSWSLDPDLRPIYQSACSWLNCELPGMRDLKKMSTRNLVVRSHPELTSALVVDAVIVNGAEFVQPFPDLELRFTAVGGLLVAGRRFTPSEYLSGGDVQADAMPRDTPIQVSLEIEDPGPDAVNYTLKFR